ncbi:MAG TPA: acyl carrier protein [Acidimicrobiales bacterium]
MSATTGETRAGNREVARDIRAFLVDSFLLGNDHGFDDADSLIEAGIVDSTGVMEVVTFLEESFGIEIADEELVADNLDSVERLAAFVGRKLDDLSPTPSAASTD